MKAIQVILYIFGVLFLLSAIFAFLPMHVLNAYLAWFSAPSFPDDPLVVYTVRNFFLVMFWCGLLLILAVHDPVKYSSVLAVLAGMCLSAAVLCYALGVRHGLPTFYYWDTASAAVVGILLLVLRAQAKAAGQPGS